MKQSSFSFLGDYKKEFGGSLLQGKRKIARPLSTKHALHLVLKSTGNALFHPGLATMKKLIRDQADKYQIKIYDISLNWSHIHCVMKIPSRQNYLAFIRTLTALMVKLISTTKGINLKGLFDLRPFTRIISWGRDFRNALEYVKLNQMEAWGLIRREKKLPKNKHKKVKLATVAKAPIPPEGELRCPSGGVTPHLPWTQKISTRAGLTESP